MVFGIILVLLLLKEAFILQNHYMVNGILAGCMKKAMNPLKVDTLQIYSPGHMVYGELQANSDFKAYGMRTTKPVVPHSQIKSIKLPVNYKVDGTQGDQFYIPFGTPQILKAGSFTITPVGNSAQQFALLNIPAIFEAQKP